MSRVIGPMKDIFKWGATKEEHRTFLCEVLRIVTEAGVTLNDSKCTFCVTEPTYLGHKV